MEAIRETTIVNVKKAELKKLGYSDFSDWNSKDYTLYVGRNMTQYIPGAIGSKWCNLFKVDKHGREGCIQLYEEMIRSNKELMDSLDELEGKELGCWCKPEGCHGDVLIKLVKEKKIKKTQVNNVTNNKNTVPENKPLKKPKKEDTNFGLKDDDFPS